MAYTKLIYIEQSDHNLESIPSKVELSVKCNEAEMDIYQLRELLENLLAAIGYHHESIEEIFCEPDIVKCCGGMEENVWGCPSCGMVIDDSDLECPHCGHNGVFNGEIQEEGL